MWSMSRPRCSCVVPMVVCPVSLASRKARNPSFEPTCVTPQNGAPRKDRLDLSQSDYSPGSTATGAGRDQMMRSPTKPYMTPVPCDDRAEDTPNAQPERDPRHLSELLRGRRPREGALGAAGAAERSVAAVRQCGHGAVQGLFHRRVQAALSARHQLAEM